MNTNKDQAVTSDDGASPSNKSNDSQTQTAENLVKRQTKRYISGMSRPPKNYFKQKKNKTNSCTLFSVSLEINKQTKKKSLIS